MAFAWPTNPSPGDTFVAPNGSPYVYTADGSWKANSLPPAPVTPEAKSWTTVNRPASPAVGRAGYNITIDNYEVWNGSIWTVVSGSNIVTAPTPPVTPKIGDMWFDTDSDTLYIRLYSTFGGNPIWFDIVGGAAQAGSNKSPFNVSMYNNKIRTPLTGQGFLYFDAGTYVKRSSTSQLLVRATSNLFSVSPFGAGAAQMRITLNGTSYHQSCENMSHETSATASNGTYLITGLPSGSLPWTIHFGRSDGAVTWSSVINPSQVDSSYLPPQGYNTTLEFSELEPV